MKDEILGLEELYRAALDKRGDNVLVSANLVIELIDRYSEYQNAIIDLRASLRTCYNTSYGALDQYGDI